MKEYIQKRINESIKIKESLLDETIMQATEDITNLIWSRIAKGNSIFFCGNGGSAADAQHLATELSGRFLHTRKAIKAEALGTNMAFTTAVANDFSFDTIFARSLEALGREGDVLVALSTSGMSKNVLKAIDQARAMNIATIGITGQLGELFAQKCDLSVMVPSTSVPRIQEAYMVLGHIICEHLENSLITLNPFEII